jgi:hypothetical protein
MRNLIVTILCFSTIAIHAQASIINIENHLTQITKTEKYRNYKNLDQLNVIADYIFNDFKKFSNKVSFQKYKVDGVEYKNIIATFGPEDAERIIVGAHYDVCGDQEGADDNASGIVGILELARLLKTKELNYRVDLVAYTLEEPPFFRTEKMGSYIHAKSLKEEEAKVFGMISVEMIGYFSDEKKSQHYPIGILSWFYGNKGNYITLVNKLGKGKFARRFSRKYKNKKTIRAKRFGAPTYITGIDWSDHLNYWNQGYSALMITDTSFLRNRNYHEKSDTMETLDFNKMAQVIDGLFQTLTDLNK